MRPLTDHDIPTLEAELRAAGHRPSHARRILREFYTARGRPRWQPDVLGKSLTAWLASEIAPRASRVLSRTVSGDGTTKLLLGFDAGGAVESVLMPAYRP